MTTASAGAAPAVVPALAGFTVGVTAARRAEELGTMLERRGAVVLHGPAIRIVPLADDADLLAATKTLVVAPPDITVATTGIGFRGWVEAAEGWGLGAHLLDALGSGTLIARGPKARGAIRATGLSDAWSPESESSAEVLEHLLAEGVEGRRIAVQLHGEPLPDVVESLTMAGAEVVEVPVYRWEPPADIGPMDRLTDAVLAGGVDVLAFTSAPAAASLLRRADERGVRDELRCGCCAVLWSRCASGRSRRRRWRRWTCPPCNRTDPGSGRWCAGWRRRCRRGRAACPSRGTGSSCAGTPCWSTATCGCCRRTG